MRGFVISHKWAEAVCIASGPSLTPEDCYLVKRWRQADDNRGVVVVNNSYLMAPWSDALYAMDRKWWSRYGETAKKNFAGAFYSLVSGSEPARKVILPGSRNSGHGAIHLAAKFGAKKIYLLGYDCQYTNGKRHWHGDHEKGMGNADKLPTWPLQFKRLSGMLENQGVSIVNCSRQTALDCFPRASLEESLCAQ